MFDINKISFLKKIVLMKQYYIEKEEEKWEGKHEKIS